jgi:hypothetical protein
MAMGRQTTLPDFKDNALKIQNFQLHSPRYVFDYYLILPPYGGRTVGWCRRLIREIESPPATSPTATDYRTWPLSG